MMLKKNKGVESRSTKDAESVLINESSDCREQSAVDKAIQRKLVEKAKLYEKLMRDGQKTLSIDRVYIVLLPYMTGSHGYDDEVAVSMRHSLVDFEAKSPIESTIAACGMDEEKKDIECNTNPSPPPRMLAPQDTDEPASTSGAGVTGFLPPPPPPRIDISVSAADLLER